MPRSGEQEIPFITREAVAILMIKIMLVSVASHTIILIFNVLGDFYRLAEGGNPFRIDELDTIYGAAIILLELLVFVFLFIKWYRKTYTVTHDSILMEYGLFFKRGTVYQLRDIETITYRETFLGKIFNYSNIWLQYSNRKIFLYAVPQPRQFIAYTQGKIDLLKQKLIS